MSPLPLSTHIHTLANGLRVAIVPQSHLQSASIAVAVRSGSRYETLATNGLSHLVEHMLFRGTKPHPSSESYHEAVESIGGNLYAATHSDHALYQINVPSENIERAIELMAEVFLEPLFENLEVEKGIIREELLEEVDENGDDIDIDILSRTQIFGAHPLGFRIAGRASSVDSFTDADVHALFRKDYVSENMVIGVSGAVDADAIERCVERAFANVRSGAKVPALAFSWLASRTAPKFAYIEHSASQSDLRLSFATLGESDPRHAALLLLGRILDDGLSTRVYREICQKRALAYHAFAEIESYEDCSIIDFGASVVHSKGLELVKAWQELVTELCRHGVSDEEVARAKRRLHWDMRRLRDESEGMSAWASVRVLLGLEHDVDTIYRRIEHLEAAQVKEAAQASFVPARAALTCVGALEDNIKAQLDAFVLRVN